MEEEELGDRMRGPVIKRVRRGAKHSGIFKMLTAVFKPLALIHQ